MSLIEYQPIRGLYILLAALGVLVTLPLDVIKNAFQAGRLRKSWTFQQALMPPLIRSLQQHQAYILWRTPLDLAAGSLGDRLEVIQPASAEKYAGVLASKEAIKPIAIPIVWYPSSSSRSPSQENPVILHIHGGSFVTLDCRPRIMAFAGKVLGSISPRVAVMGYRLSSNSGGVFPAALQDALTAYLFFLHREDSGKNVILSGDSAGANIVLGLLRYISSPKGKALGIQEPKAALLWSPWVDIASIWHNPAVVDNNPNAKFDFCNSSMLGWGAKALGTVEDVQSPYVTSLGHPFPTSTLLWYQVGDAEVMHDECVESYDQMRSIAGNTAALHVESGAVHDILVTGDIIGFEEAAFRSAEKAKEFLAATN